MKNLDPREIEMMNEVVSGGFTLGQLHEAFDKVKDASNWKLPVNKIIGLTEEQKAMTKEAVIWFTGSVPTFRDLSSYPGGSGRYHVTAPGYYEAVGA